MSTKLAVTVVGTVVGAYFGYPQLGAMAGALIGSAIDPTVIQGPKIKEGGSQTVAEGVPRPILFGTAPCTGNVIQRGPLRIEETRTSQGKGSTKVEGEIALRTYAIGICEGPMAAILQVWRNKKLVYDVRPGSGMLAESERWAANKRFYMGDESQLPDPDLELLDADATAHRGTVYMVAIDDDLTDMQGSIPQYEFEVAQFTNPAAWPGYTWTVEQSTAWTAPCSIASSGAVTVASGQGSTSWYSSDLDNWTSASTPFGLSMLAYGNAGFVGINTGNNNQVAVGDGSAWVSGTMALTQQKSGVAYGNGVYVAVGQSGVGTVNVRAEVSADGLTWTSNLIVSGGSASVGDIRFVNGRFVAFTSGSTFYESNSGLTWTLRTAPFATMTDIAYSAPLGLYVMVGGTSLAAVATSPDLINWTTRTTPSGTFASIAWCDELGLFACCGSNVFCTSTDGITWTAHGTLPTGYYGQLVWVPEEGKFATCSVTPSQIVVSDSMPGSPGSPIELSEIVAALYQRCGVQSVQYDVTELTDLVLGYPIASGGYTAADAVDATRLAYFFDKCVRDKKIYHPKRGKAVAKTLTYLDLTSSTDSNRREQANEIPYKLNVRYSNPDSGYAVLKETTGSTSPDRRTTGEVTLDVPVCMTADPAAQIADKQYKVTLAEMDGTMELTVMLDVALDLAEGDCIGYIDRLGQTYRLRIEQMEFFDWQIKLTCKADRQSSYTSNVTGIPAPAPTLPPSTIVGDTVFAIIDGSARIDSEDNLGYLAAATGPLPPWYGAELQRSLDGGASYTPIYEFERAAIMGVLLEDLPSASEFYTDTTNTVKVQLYRDQNIDDLTEVQFLTGQGVFALEKADGTYEYMQGRDVSDEGSNVFHLTRLHRGLLNSGADAHITGARFVWLTDAVHIGASSAWLGLALTHRAVSFDQAEDEVTNDETDTFVGRSQLEWAPVHLTLSRDMSDILAGSAVPRYRFGSPMNPVDSINHTGGYRWTVDDGSSSVSFDTALPEFSGFDASGMSSPVTVTMGAVNRITGLGQTTSGTV